MKQLAHTPLLMSALNGLGMIYDVCVSVLDVLEGCAATVVGGKTSYKSGQLIYFKCVHAVVNPEAHSPVRSYSVYMQPCVRACKTHWVCWEHNG